MNRIGTTVSKRLGWIILSVFIFHVSFLRASDTLTTNLQYCRDMAITHSASSKAGDEARLAAEYNRKAALAAMFPRVSANGGYMWNSRQMHFFSNTLALSLGTSTIADDGTASFKWNSGAQGTLPDAAGQVIADVHKFIYDATTADITHVVVAQASVMQPIYTGGRLTQLYHIAKSAENIANLESSAKREAILYAVDEAYWRVVSVAQKKRLAEQYYNLLCQLEKDVQAALDEGLVTQSDLLKVMTKRGEAEVKKLQAENGLILSNMALAQVCGLPLSTTFELDETGLNETALTTSDFNAESAVSSRSELLILQESEKIAKRTAKLASAGLQPNIIAQASYTYTNPNAENGVSSNWDGKGFFSAGVVVNVPIVHADDILRYKAAKHTANLMSLKTEETRELLMLQTTQANQKLMEAQQKIVMARMTLNNAQEVLRMAEASFEAGMITSSDLMQAQTLWLSAATDLIDAEVEAKTTEAQLKKFLGQL